MRYVPDLIPEDLKVLPDYFKGSIYDTKRKNSLISILSYVGAAIFFLLALSFFRHPLIGLSSAIVGLIILPEGQRWVEKSLRFRLTAKIKSILCAIVIISPIPLAIHYSELDKNEAEQEKVRQTIIEQKNAETNRREQLRRDSFEYFLGESIKLNKLNKLDGALSKLDSAANYALTQTEIDRISKQKVAILSTKTFSLVKVGKYIAAIPQLAGLILLEPNNADLFYNRGICYNKTGKIQEAVADFRTAIDLGNPNAEASFNKINPIRKRVIGYFSQCCDGTTSSSTGRGACSHHGGVCGTKSIYELTRKYGAKNKSEEESFKTGY